MKSKIVLLGAVAGAMAMGAMTTVAQATDLGVGTRTGVGVNTPVANVGVGTRVGADIDGRDASGGIMARSDTDVNADIERSRTYDRSDARFNSGVSAGLNSDTSAGADPEADLRSRIRSEASFDAGAVTPSQNIDSATGLRLDTSGRTLSPDVSVDAGLRSRVGTGYNN